MDKQKTLTILLSMILLLLIIGISYALYKADIDNSKRQEVTLTAANLSLRYTDCASTNQADCANITAKLTPGESISKTFQVENVGNSPAGYKIIFKELINNFKNDELTYKIENLDSGKVIAESPVPYHETNQTNINLLNDSLPILPTKIDKYKITITFLDKPYDQIANKTASFKIKMGISSAEYVPPITLAQQILDTVPLVTTGPGLYHHDSNLTNGAGDNSYRYAGADAEVNNHVCFGSDASPCPEDNQYRIIGIYDNKVKLIKTKDINSGHTLAWDSGNNNDWTKSSLNNHLNTTFYNSLGNEKNYIVNTNWQVGGNTDSKISGAVPKGTYQNEIISPASSVTHSAKIGLMYANEYGFATTSDYWGKTLYTYDGGINSNGTAAKNKDWLFNQTGSQLTITRKTEDSNMAFSIYHDGRLSASGTQAIICTIRPVFNLEPTLPYISGDGSKGLPYIIK